MDDPELAAAMKRAIDYSVAAYPDEEGQRASLRAAEPDRFIFAVFIKPVRGLLPPPYRLLAVSRVSGEVRKLAPTEGEPYRIPNYK